MKVHNLSLPPKKKKMCDFKRLTQGIPEINELSEWRNIFEFFFCSYHSIYAFGQFLLMILSRIQTINNKYSNNNALEISRRIRLYDIGFPFCGTFRPE